MVTTQVGGSFFSEPKKNEPKKNDTKNQIAEAVKGAGASASKQKNVKGGGNRGNTQPLPNG